MKRSAWFLSKVLLLPAVAYCLLLGSLLLLATPVAIRTFDADAWKASRRNMEQLGIRFDMIQGLLESGGLVGLSENQTIEQLGEPDRRSPEPPARLEYSLGRDPRNQMGSQWLAVELGADGRVRGASIRLE